MGSFSGLVTSTCLGCGQNMSLESILIPGYPLDFVYVGGGNLTIGGVLFFTERPRMSNCLFFGGVLLATGNRC